VQSQDGTNGDADRNTIIELILFSAAEIILLSAAEIILLSATRVPWDSEHHGCRGIEETIALNKTPKYLISESALVGGCSDGRQMTLPGLSFWCLSTGGSTRGDARDPWRAQFNVVMPIPGILFKKKKKTKQIPHSNCNRNHTPIPCYIEKKIIQVTLVR
jgi:hypothetical protein